MIAVSIIAISLFFGGYHFLFVIPCRSWRPWCW